MEEDNFDIAERLVGYESSKQLHNSKAYKLLQEHQVDNSEILGIDKQPEAGSYPIRDKEPELQKAKENNFLEGFLELGESLKNSDVITSIKSRVPEGLINIADFGTNIFNSFDKLFSLDPTYERSEIFNKWSENFDNTRNILREKRKEVQNTWSDMAGMVFQDLPATLALYPVFNKFMSKPKAAALAFGVGYAMAFDEEKTSIFMDSETLTKLKHLIKILPDTPESDLADNVIEAFEGTAMVLLIPGLIKGFQFIKKTLPKETVSDIAQITAGGSVIAGSFMQDAQGKEIPPIPEPININEKPTIDVSEPKFMEMGFQSALSKGVVPKIIEKGKEILKPIFKSNVVEAVNKIPNKGSGPQILGQIKNIPGVKESELKWIGLDDFLKNKKTVTKQEVSEFVQANRIDVNETKFGGEQFAKYSDDIEFQINDFESKWSKIKNKDPYTLGAEPNYDVYRFGTSSNIKGFSTKGVSEKIKHDRKLDFNQLMDAVDFHRQGNLERFLKDDWLINGNVTIARLFDDRAGTTVRTSLKLARKLLRNEVDKKRYSMERVIEIPELEFEKAIVENAKRAFNQQHKGTKFIGQTEPGGTDYTELVFSIKKGGMDIGIPTRSKYPKTKPPGYEGPVGFIHEKGTTPYKGAHLGVKSEIAHVRFKTRDLNGKKVLSVEEMQSDFGIKATMAFKQIGKITDFPFKQNWYELVIKRLIRYAADNGFDAIAIPKGSVPAKRYGQKINMTKKIEIDKSGKFYKVSLFNDEGKYSSLEYSKVGHGSEVLKRDIGEKVFNQITKNESGIQTFNFDKPIIIGSGKGKAELYDKAIPSFMRKYSKKWNAKVYDDVFKGKKQEVSTLSPGVRDMIESARSAKDFNIPVTILEITPAMKKAVQEGSQSLFEILGFATAGAVTSKAVSENIQNNNISN